MKLLTAAMILLFAGPALAASRVPLPKPRPRASEQAMPQPEAAPAAKEQSASPSVAEKPEPPKPSACQLALAAIAVFKPLPPINGTGKWECTVDDPVSLEAAVLPDGAHVTVNPPATLRCEMARTVAQWLRDDAAREVAPLGSPLRGIENYDSYDCRPRNRVFGAKISEHGRGNALDIRALKLADGTVDQLTDPHLDKGVREALRKSACERFHTVLGPGSDGYHESHIHVDLAPRRHDYRICQWDIRVPFDGWEPSAHIVGSRLPTPHVSMGTGAKAAPAPSVAPPRSPSILPKPRPRRTTRVR